MAPDVDDALCTEVLQLVVETASPTAKRVAVTPVPESGDGVSHMTEVSGLGVERIVKVEGVFRHIPRPEGGRADQVDCVFHRVRIKYADIESVHQPDFDVADEIGAVQADRLRCTVRGLGHGPNENLQFHGNVK